MTSDEKRLLRHLQSSYDNPNIYYQVHYSPARFWDRLTQPTILISLIALAAVAYYSLALQNPHLLPPLPDLVWDNVVRIIPARLLYAVDGWLNPPLFPNPELRAEAQPSTHTAKSEALKRMLGVNRPGSIMTIVSEVGRRRLGSLGGRPLAAWKGNSERPAGLENWDNSCYQNSVLQALASLKPLRSYLGRLGDTPETEPSPVDTLRLLLQDLSGTASNGKTLRAPILLKTMSTVLQQDAQEYYSKLVDLVHNMSAKLAQAAQKPAGFERDLSTARDDTAVSHDVKDSGYLSASTPPTIERNPLEGFQAQRVACTACGYAEGLSMIPFSWLTLNLGTDGRDHDLYELLDASTKVEYIPDVECPKCTLLEMRKIFSERLTNRPSPEEDLSALSVLLGVINLMLEEDDYDDDLLKRLNITAKVSSTKTKQAVIARPPQCLVVHMNRSVFDERTGHLFKNSAAVRFPTMLDLGPWCLGSRAADDEAEQREDWLLDPNVSMVAGNSGQSKISGPIYELRAAVTHHGRHENGHYVCYRRHGRARPAKVMDGMEAPAQPADDEMDGAQQNETSAIDFGEEADKPKPQDAPEEYDDHESQWWQLSDRDVMEVDEETVLGQSDVFMLFYDRVDSTQSPVTDTDEHVDVISAHGGDSGEEATADDMLVDELEHPVSSLYPDEDEDL